MIEHMLHVRALQAGRRWYDEERRSAPRREAADESRRTPPGGYGRRILSPIVAVIAPAPRVPRRGRANA